MSYIDKKYYSKFPKKQLDELEKEVQAEVQKMIRENVDIIVHAFENSVDDVLDDLEEGEWTDIDIIKEHCEDFYFG